MHVLICNERFLFRFGADRVLMLLAKGLRSAGHRVTLMANRCDSVIANSVVDRVITAPERDGEYLNGNEITANWLEEAWPALFGASAVDVAIVGGWPFLASLSLLKERCSRVLFVDFGAVPLDGLTGGALTTQQKLRQMRSLNLRYASQVIAISEFIRRTQSEPDSGGAVPTRTVLLGANHLDLPLWSTANVRQASGSGSALQIAQKLRSAGKKLILNLGRWEPGCYKNSLEALRVVHQVKEKAPETALLILDNDVAVSDDLRGIVHPVGFPDDADLVSLMKTVDLGISVSLWEGFNLPIAEMQWLGVPVLAFNVGAHPEVVAMPWLLCRDTDEMAEKAATILSRGMPDAAQHQQMLRTFRDTFRWDRFVSEYSAVLNEDVVSQRPLQPVVDVTSSTIDPANSGVIRVTRRLCREMQNSLDPYFAVWDQTGGRYVLPTAAEYFQLSQFTGPVPPASTRMSPDGSARIAISEVLGSMAADRWLIITETVPASRLSDAIRHARSLGLRCAAIFYDAIPVLRPDLCNEETRLNHAGYMTTLACCDLVVPISDFSAECLRRFWTEQGIQGCIISSNPLPGEFGGAPRSLSAGERDGAVNILCVSTLEPRKNHRRLLAACQRMGREHPEVDWTLTLIGNRYAGAFDLADEVEALAKRDTRIRWHGIVDDATLAREYNRATFTIYPSLIEGFGMPVLESMWHGKPCVCANSGVMAEHAAEGGCLTVDVHDEDALYRAIVQLCTDEQLWGSLSRQALSRHIKTWSDYAAQFLTLLRSVPLSGITAGRTSLGAATSRSLPAIHSSRWSDILYPGCLLERWQMNDSERLALTALLARQKPVCSIEVGTYHGGSLSLIAQYSASVVSIDIDPTVSTRIGPIPNVHYLVGSSVDLLPRLLREFTRSSVSVEFILIDGDHSSEGIKRDIAAILDYAPLKPLFVLMHDSFNPDCRRGMLECDWSMSPWCHAVEIDFVPGRVVEHNGPSQGELWGGLAMAYFSPIRRNHHLTPGRACEGMFQRLSKGRSAGASDA